MADPERSKELARARVRRWNTAHPERARDFATRWARNNPELCAFTKQRHRAKERGIEFLLTFEEWWAIWQTSGKWEQRGKYGGRYVMARFGDVGPYAVGNVRICAMEANLIEAHRGRKISEETRKRMRIAAKAREAKKRGK